MQLISRFKILPKLLAILAFISGIVGGCAWYAQSRMSQIDDAYSLFIEHEAKAVASARQTSQLIFSLNYLVFRIIAETDEAQIKDADGSFEATLPKLTKVLADLRGQAPTFVTRIDAQTVRVKQFVQDVSEVRRLGILNRNDDALALMHKTIDPTFLAMTQEGGTLAEDIAKYMDTDSEILTRQTNTTRYALMIFSVLGLLGGMLAAIVVSVFGITRPIGSLVGVLQRMASGDIDAQIPEAARGDEIGAVGRAVEGIKTMVAAKAAEQAEIKRAADEAAAVARRRTMVELANGFERAVGSVVGMVSASATELQTTARTMSATATETASQSTTVAAAAEEAATNVHTVAAAAEELGSSIQEIGRQVAGSSNLAQTAVDEADQTLLLVQALSQASSRIGDMVGLIANIASQTNLLALNATIEAARAGESGRGFAVVATEVKELAAQTARATDEIGSQISQIQGATGQAVSAIGGIAARIREINEVAASIAAAVEQQGAATQEIVRNVAQASTGTGDVTSNIAGVAQASEETGAAAAQVLSAASELSRQSEHLGTEVARFLGTVRAA